MSPIVFHIENDEPRVDSRMEISNEVHIFYMEHNMGDMNLYNVKNKIKTTKTREIWRN